MTENLIILRCIHKRYYGRWHLDDDPEYKEYLELHKKIVQLQRSLDSELVLISQVKVIFRGKQVLFYAKNLEAVIETLHDDDRLKNNTFIENEITHYFKVIASLFKMLLTEMGREINCETEI